MLVYFLLMVSLLGDTGARYPLFLLCALIPFRYFSVVLSESLTLISRYSAMITNVPVSKWYMPLGLLISQVGTLLFALILLFPFLFSYGIVPWPSILWLPILLLQVMMLSAGPVFLGILVGVYASGIRGALTNLIRVSFFASTGLVAAERFSDGRFATIIRYNPLSSVFDSFRAVFLDSQNPEAFDLIYPFGVGGLVLLVGISVYRWQSPTLPKEV